jgi:enamine deaminase RidA (YjgF/YER057c/UK114 family)
MTNAISSAGISSGGIRRFHVAARYSDMAVHGGVAYLAGQVPSDATAPVSAQVAQVLQQIDDLLALAGSDRGQILMATVYLPDLADYDAMNLVWENWLKDVQAPPRATVQARLANAAWKVEIVVTAAVSGAKEASAAV